MFGYIVALSNLLPAVLKNARDLVSTFIVSGLVHPTQPKQVKTNAQAP